MNHIKKLVYTAVFIAIGIVLPFLTGQIPEIGAALCPMHLPVILCGFICGWQWGLAAGIVTPILRSVIFGMPPMFPTATAMAFELAAYGAVAGILYRILPKKIGYIYCSLVAAMIAGRLIWGGVMFFFTSGFGMSAFFAGAVLNAVPGMIVQITLIPVLVMAMKQAKLILNE